VHDLSLLRLVNGEPLPTLAQALDVIGPTLKVFVEVKVLDPRWDERLLAMLDQGPNPAGYAIHSFASHVVRRLGQKRPTLPRGILSEVEMRSPKQTLDDATAQTLWQERSSLDEQLVKTVHGLGASLFAWTVDNPTDLERLVRWGVDGLCTNHPERARRVVDARAA
jgi:glycerophosphoryl diester phosphodiesterase